MALLIKASEENTEEFEMPQKINLRFYQQKVGGTIEFIRFKDGSEMMVNEEGMVLDLPKNARASSVASLKGWEGDVLYGDVVFFTAKEAQLFYRDESDNDDQETLENIADILSGKEWNSETCNEIASLMREAGYEIAGI
jgi:hypothetical protein